MIRAYSATILVVMLAAAPVVVQADTLYSAIPDSSTATQNRGPISYFTDTKAHAVGDLLTVVITETAVGSSTGTTTGSKSESATFGPGFGGILRLIKQFGLSGNENSTATGATNRAGNLTATIAVTVKKVDPNGNLEVEGARSVGVNAEAQTVTLSGVVRPTDIGPNNTVQSPLVANAQIKYSGNGPVGEVQHDGIVRKIFRLLF